MPGLLFYVCRDRVDVIHIEVEACSVRVAVAYLGGGVVMFVFSDYGGCGRWEVRGRGWRLLGQLIGRCLCGGDDLGGGPSGEPLEVTREYAP